MPVTLALREQRQEDAEKGETLYTAGGNVNYSSHYESQYKGFQKHNEPFSVPPAISQIMTEILLISNGSLALA